MAHKDVYPEHDKLHVVHHEAQKIGAFLEWLTGERGVSLMRYPTEAEIEASAEEDEDGWTGYNLSADRPLPFFAPGGFPEGLLAEYFQIDQKKLEAEKVAMLNRLRKDNDARSK